MIRRPPRSTLSSSSAASDVYKRQVITEGKQHEIGVARQLRYEPGTLLVIDRGYLDYGWFADLSQQGVYFVTRMKDNADYMVLQERELPRRKGLLRDQVICFYQQARDGEECYFR